MMRAFFIAAAALMPWSAYAQTEKPAVERPLETAPTATASFEQRESWCVKYTSWLVANTPQEGAAPADVDETHRFEVEFNSCKIDPATYERQTLAEAQIARSAES